MWLCWPCGEEKVVCCIHWVWVKTVFNCQPKLSLHPRNSATELLGHSLITIHQEAFLSAPDPSWQPWCASTGSSYCLVYGSSQVPFFSWALPLPCLDRTSAENSTVFAQLMQRCTCKNSYGNEVVLKPGPPTVCSGSHIYCAYWLLQVPSMSYTDGILALQCKLWANIAFIYNIAGKISLICNDITKHISTYGFMDQFK